MKEKRFLDLWDIEFPPHLDLVELLFVGLLCFVFVYNSILLIGGELKPFENLFLEDELQQLYP